MNSKTVVCAYGKNEPIERIFERLHAMYLSNFSRSYVYCALIDLPDAFCYRNAGDGELEEKAERYIKRLENECEGQFFCGIRQRRIEWESRMYKCEFGAAGAMKALWRHICGKENELYPTFGGAVLSEAERVYFSSERGYAGEPITVIEPNGIFKLGSSLTEYDAVFAFAGAMKGAKTHLPDADIPLTESIFTDTAGILDDRCEGIYSASTLDRMLFADSSVIRSAVMGSVGLSFFEKSFLKNFRGSPDR